MRANKSDDNRFERMNKPAPINSAFTHNTTPGTLITNRLSNGYDLTDGRLHILIPDKLSQDAQDILDNLRKDFADAEEIMKPKLTIDDCTRELDRLVNLAAGLVSGEPFNLFQYLPLTKQGKFPNNQNILIADSKVTAAATWTGGAGDYPEKLTVQLRLMPYYGSTDDFIYGNAMEDTRILELQWFDSIKKRTPVFDENNVPAKPETKRATYLKDEEIKPGYVYEEKSGTQFLYLTGLPFAATTIYRYDDGEIQKRTKLFGTKKYTSNLGTSDLFHEYLRWTKKLEAQLTLPCSLNDFLRVMYANDKKNTKSWTESGSISSREHPRKFVREVCQVIDLSASHSETFDITVTKADDPELYTASETYRYKVTMP